MYGVLVEVVVAVEKAGEADTLVGVAEDAIEVRLLAVVGTWFCEEEGGAMGVKALLREGNVNLLSSDDSSGCCTEVWMECGRVWLFRCCWAGEEEGALPNATRRWKGDLRMGMGECTGELLRRTAGAEGCLAFPDSRRSAEKQFSKMKEITHCFN